MDFKDILLKGESESEGQTVSPTSRKKCIPPSENIPKITQQDFRITFKYFNYCILGLTHRKYILTVTGYNNQIRTV